MITSTAEYLAIARAIYGDKLPKPLDQLETSLLVERGLEIAAVASALKTTRAKVASILSAPDPWQVVMGGVLAPTPEDAAKKIRSMLGQLLLGAVSERVFERIYRDRMGMTDLDLRDDRSTRGDTDYFVYNGGGKQLFRLNIKFFGSIFRKAEEMVGLQPDDCFALATYKIHSALKKQEAEHLPYIFAIVGVPNLTGRLIGERLPEDLIQFAHLTSPKVGKRDLEDLIVDRLVSNPDSFDFDDQVAELFRSVGAAQWYVISARKANNLLRDLLFERVYALQYRAFARNFSGAEIDMHFSLTRDLTTVQAFLDVYKEGGLIKLAGVLERGTI